MRRSLRVFALSIVVPALLLSGVAGASISPTYTRLNLLAADSDYLYWSVDRFDPELGVSAVSRTCGANVYSLPGHSKPCLSGVNLADGSRLYSLFFLPASVLEENVTWSVAEPLKFHLEGTINTLGAPYTVHFVLQKGTDIVESPAAAQTAPGVWEGQISTGSPLSSKGVNILAIRVRTPAPAATIQLNLAGRSFLELPRAFPIRGVPDLVRDDTYSTQPTSLATATRSFTFNDAQWETRSFTGRTGPLREFSFDLAQKAEILMAWVEVFDSTFVQDIERGRPPNPQKIRQGAAIRLSRDGSEIDHSGFGNGVGGWGTEALAVLDLAPGPLTLTVDSANEDESQSMPFTVHVLEVRGERTLRSMRWKFTQTNSLRLPSVGVCPGAAEPIPATDEVRSIALDLDWDSAAVGIPAWTIRFDLPGVGSFPCGEAGTGDELRLTIPTEQVWYVGATPSQDSLHVSAYDTTFELQAEYVYSAPPAI